MLKCPEDEGRKQSRQADAECGGWSLNALNAVQAIKAGRLSKVGIRDNLVGGRDQAAPRRISADGRWCGEPFFAQTDWRF